jgi:hypothetical protein
MAQEKDSADIAEIVIDQLVSQFHGSVKVMAHNPDKYSEMLALLKNYNPQFLPRRY